MKTFAELTKNDYIYRITIFNKKLYLKRFKVIYTKIYGDYISCEIEQYNDNKFYTVHHNFMKVDSIYRFRSKYNFVWYFADLEFIKDWISYRKEDITNVLDKIYKYENF